MFLLQSAVKKSVTMKLNRPGISVGVVSMKTTASALLKSHEAELALVQSRKAELLKTRRASTQPVPANVPLTEGVASPRLEAW